MLAQLRTNNESVYLCDRQELYIRIGSNTLSHRPRAVSHKKRRTALRRRLFRSQKRLVRASLLVANMALLVVVIGFVVKAPSGNQTLSSNASILSAEAEEPTGPLDQLSSADIAVHVARMTRLSEATSVVNNADSVNAKLAQAASISTIVPKPQLVTTEGIKSIQDLERYLTKPGDTISKLAAKFGITSDSIKWSNNLTGNELTSDVYLWIPPVDGVVHLVQADDTVTSLARDFKTSKEAIILFNDIELTGLRRGSRIVIPDGKKIAPGVSSASSFNLVFLGGGGGYDPGWCTYYASAQAGVPGGWGNANTWHLYAPLSGWTVSSTPRVGAVAQSTTGWAGHVGIVHAVKVKEGQYFIKYSDMNGLAGFNRVGYSDWVPATSKYQHFIYR